MTEIKSGTIQAVGTPRRFQGVAKTGPNAGNPYDFTVYKFKLDDGNWYDTRKDPERIVQGAAVQFSYDEEPWERNGKSGINRTVKEFFGGDNPTVANTPQTHDVSHTQTQPPQKKDSYTLGVIFGNLFTNAVQMHLKHGADIQGVDGEVGMAREDVLKWFRVLNDTRLEAEKYFYSMTDAPPQPQTESAPTQSDTPEPKNLGELLTTAHQRWGITKTQVAETLKLDLATIVDFGQALAQLEFAQMGSVKG